ncbi:hypothetical protein EVJ20_03200 [Exiguobacterium sp. SH0S1]|uniref:hypothetical protein n=1 Tax=Exiguobacterium sp. SH0S1 TaxID=2510949 RepID=UPI00103BF1C1|nr:hypothetical protein [Exiguobacterium sp. SH0S1]TCI80335.1 hypothetical protein EVJ20_03200 [Exiguobacterium sp. SH0S1]
MENLFNGLMGVVLIAGVIAGIARHDFRKRKNEYMDTVERKNKYKRTTRRIDLTLAASVILMFALFYFEPNVPKSPASQQGPVVADTSGETLPEGVYGPGTYKVGADIPAGEYKLAAVESDYRGYYEVKDDMSSDGGILSNSLFDCTEYVEVQSGEYLSVTRATFTLVAQSSSIKSDPETKVDEEAPVEKSTESDIPYPFASTQAEADFFTAIGLTLENGIATMRDASSMSRVCGKVCPDVPGSDWGLQLEPMNQEVFELDHTLYDFARSLKDIPEGSSPNIDFEERDILVKDMERMSEYISLLMTHNDWATWQEAWDKMEEANLLIEKMYATEVYTVPR